MSEDTKPTAPGPEYPTEYETLYEKAMSYTQALQSVHESSWGLGKAETFEVDLESGFIQFDFENEKIVTAPITLIGTWAAGPAAFLWGWDYPMCPPADNSAAQAVKSFADKHDMAELQMSEVECDGDAAWELAAIACLIGELQGIYRAPHGNNLVYLGFGDVTVSKLPS